MTLSSSSGGSPGGGFEIEDGEMEKCHLAGSSSGRPVD